MKKLCYYAAIVGSLCACSVNAQDDRTLSENRFQERMRGLNGARSEEDRLRWAKDLVSRHLLSSLQVKTIAARFGDDAARLEFATAAYPQTIDPENFYEVYDAFKTFSKVMRLHDRIHEFPRAVPVAAVQPVSDDELQEMLRALRKESFDNTRSQLAREMLRSSQKPFLAAQIKQIVSCFDFDPSRLDVARFAYEYTLDREKYFVVNDAFTFANSKEDLLRYVQSHTPSAPPPSRR
jgi:hypothetical protein